MLNAVILAGGLSTRFGSCKTKLYFNEESVLEKTFNLLSLYCDNVRVATKKNREITEEVGKYPLIYDISAYNAPITGIYSALEYYNSPTLVLPCDLPLINKDIIEKLIEERNRAIEKNSDLCMTTFQQKDSIFIEALIAIYEVKALQKLEKALQQRQYSLFKIIPEELRHHIIIESVDIFYNINHPQDIEIAQELAKK